MWLLVMEVWVEKDQQTGSPTDKQKVITDTGGARPGNRSGCRKFEVENGLK